MLAFYHLNFSLYRKFDDDVYVEVFNCSPVLHDYCMEGYSPMVLVTNMDQVKVKKGALLKILNTVVHGTNCHFVTNLTERQQKVVPTTVQELHSMFARMEYDIRSIAED